MVEEFPGYKVINGDPRHSDHRLVIISTEWSEGRGRRRSAKRGFRFEAARLQEEKCEEVVGEAWQRAMNGEQKCAHAALKAVAGNLMDWSKNFLGDLEKRIKKVKSELEACRSSNISPNQVRREEMLRFKLERLEDQGDIYWKQRAHVRWL